MAESARTPALEASVGWLLVSLPVLASFALVARYGVDVPFLDQWDMASLFTKAAAGELGLGDLLAQHNESRVLVPKLIWLAVGSWTSWNVHVEMFLTQLALCGITGNLLWLARRSGDFARRDLWVLGAIATWLLFSPVQWWNFTFGFPLVVYLPALCLSGCLVLAGSQRGAALRFGGCAVLSAISTFCFANGMLCWVLVPFALLAREGMRGERSTVRWVFWLSSASLCLAIYFSGYAAPTHHPGFAAALEQMSTTFVAFFAFFGSPFSFGTESVAVAALIGALQWSWGAGLLTALWRNRLDSTELRAASPWLILAAYSVASGALATVGRIGFGPEAILHSRLTAFSLPLPVALAFLTSILLRRVRNQPSPTPRWPRTAAMGLLCLFAILHGASFVVALEKFPAQRDQRLRAKAALLMTLHYVSEDIEAFLYPDAPKVVSRAREIDALGYLRPPLVRDLRTALPGSDLGDPRVGSLDSVVSLEAGWVGAEGWSILVDEERPSDAVVLATRSDAGVAVVGLAHPQVRADELPRFRKRVRASAKSLEAWSLDAKTGRLQRLAGKGGSSTLAPGSEAR